MSEAEMAYIETACPGCQQTLRVSGQYSGKQAKCPACGSLYVVPEAPLLAADPEIWWVRIPEGKIYGPVTGSQLDRWVSEGRISDECLLSRDARATWERAEREYPVLAPVALQGLRTGSPFGLVTGHVDDNGTNVPAQDPNIPRQRYLAPHRSGIILALGLCSWTLCPFLGFFAWAMGGADLRDMMDGRMDPSGEPMTRAGFILGMIQSVIAVFLVIAGLILLVARYA